MEHFFLNNSDNRRSVYSYFNENNYNQYDNKQNRYVNNNNRDVNQQK